VAPLRVLWCWGMRPHHRQLLEALEVEYFSGGQADLAAAVSRADAILIRRGLVLDAGVLAAAPRLRYIIRAGTNTGNVDLGFAAERGLTVSATPMHIDVAVAEHALGLMLALTRGTVRAHDDVVEARYRVLGLTPELTSESSMATNWMGYERIPTLFGRRLGLVGLGEIGSAVASRARAFGMKVIYYQRRRLGPDDERARGVQYSSLVELCAASDFVSLHVPDTPETVHLMDAAHLSLMASTSYLVNVSRGRVVDETALAQALQDGRIAGAGLDVFECEPLPVDSALLRTPNVILTPHIASGTDIEQDIDRLIRNLGLVALGHAPEDIVAGPGVDRSQWT
jgi:phosphoglycerate dehydrogenase-like enzyme